MLRDGLVILLGVWLVIFAFLEFESDEVDVAITAYTGLLVLALGVWGLWCERRMARDLREREASPASGIQANPTLIGASDTEPDDDPPPGFRGAPRDPTDISTG